MAKLRESGLSEHQAKIIDLVQTMRDELGIERNSSFRGERALVAEAMDTIERVAFAGILRGLLTEPSIADG